jgi:hypothetical protein
LINKFGQGFTGLADLIDECILFEPQIWSRGSDEVRNAYFKNVSYLIFETPDDSLTRFRSLDYWLDCAEQFYGMQNGEKHLWQIIETLSFQATTESDANRLAESLWCCINSPSGFCLYQILSELVFRNQPFFNLLLTQNRIPLLLRIFQSVHREIRLIGLKLVQAIFEDPIRFQDLCSEFQELEAEVWIQLYETKDISSEEYALLSKIALSKVSTASLETTQIGANDLFYPQFIVLVLELMATKKCHESCDVLSFLDDTVAAAESGRLILEGLLTKVSLQSWILIIHNYANLYSGDESLTERVTNRVLFMLSCTILNIPVDSELYRDIFCLIFVTFEYPVASRIAMNLILFSIKRFQTLFANNLKLLSHVYVFNSGKCIGYFFGHGRSIVQSQKYH